MKDVIKAALVLLVTFFSLSLQAQVSYQDWLFLSQTFENEFEPDLKRLNSEIKINPNPAGLPADYWWNLDDVHASYTSSVTDAGTTIHNLFIFGGYARVSGMTVEGVAAALCHELGHGIGGPPFKSSSEFGSVAVEGQADDFAFRRCLPRLLKRIPQGRPSVPTPKFAKDLCLKYRGFPLEDHLICLRLFEVMGTERIILNWNLSPNEGASFLRTDPHIANDIVTESGYYPSPQCRLDTMVNATLGLERPRCWWVPERFKREARGL